MKLETKEYAFIQIAQSDVQYGTHGKHMPLTPYSDFGDSLYPIGKGKRMFDKNPPKVTAKCKELEFDFERFKIEADKIIKNK